MPFVNEIPRDNECFARITISTDKKTRTYEVMANNEMLDHYNFSRATYSREKKKAVGMLGIVLWGFVLPSYQKQEVSKY